MKKSIAVLIALILMMTAVFFGCGKKEKTEDEKETEEVVQQTEGDGTTAENGDIVFNPNTGATSASTPDVTAPSVTPSTAPSTAPSTGSSEASTSPSLPAVTPSQPSTSTPSQSTSYLAGTNLEKYSQYFKAGTYSMTITTVSNGVDDIPVDFACKNGNVRMGMSMEGIPAIMIYRADNDTAYMLFEMMGKFYTELTEELIGEEIDFSEATDGFEIPENGTLTVTKETFNGTAVTAETVTADGKTATFYFDNSGNLVGTKSVKDGEASVSKISNFSTNVADSLFEIPNGYVYMDMSWLM